MTRHRITDADDRSQGATQAGCGAVMDQFDRFRAWVVRELEKCPDDGTAPVRRDELIHSINALNRKIAIMRRIAGDEAGERS